MNRSSFNVSFEKTIEILRHLKLLQLNATSEYSLISLKVHYSYQIFHLLLQQRQKHIPYNQFPLRFCVFFKLNKLLNKIATDH